MTHIIAPSILSADFGNLQRDIEMINQSEADWFHLDIMDGHFVPNLSFGFPVVKAIANHAKKPIDIHLMIEKPDIYIERFAKEGNAAYLTVHYEACNHLHRTVALIHSLGVKAGVSLNPHTPIAVLVDILPFVDMVLLMSVNPGFGGQSFIEHTLLKIKQLKEIIDKNKYPVILQVDGGIGLDNYQQLLSAGANALVCGNSIFSSPNPMETIKKMKVFNPNI
ncbi:MAG: ribulose-phosphate 3-epimerase [Bacteroidales bacterium]|jgi:ribulose-phosphate 3-epimerase|nr:ribulose-phosphate 3-epimerase [Bacteroidales bacterium]